MSLLFFIFIITLLVVLMLLFVPIKVEIKYRSSSKKNENIEYDSCIKIYIFNIVKVKTLKNISKDKMKKTNIKFINILKIVFEYIKELYISKKQSEKYISQKDFDKLLKNIKFKKLHLYFGYNLNNVVLNAYMMAIINTVINMIFAKNIDNLNLDDTKYNTYISDKILDLDIQCILSFKLVNTITIILKLFYKYRKAVKKDGAKSSNRKFNDDSYDFT